MAENSEGVEFYIDADAAAVLAAGKAVTKTTDEMAADFMKVDKATKDLIAKQLTLGNTIDKNGKVFNKQGKEVKGATTALSKLTQKTAELNAISAKTQQVQNGLVNVHAKASGAMAGLSKKTGQASIQMQQFIGQVQGGQSPMVALSQQAADLGIVLGAPLIGSVVGISASLVGMLMPSLLKSSDSTEDLIEKLNELKETQLLTADQAKFLSQQESKTLSEKEKTLAALEKEIAANERTAKQYKDVGGSISATSQFLRGYNTTQESSEEATKKLNEKIIEQKANYSLLKQEVDESRKKIQQLNLISADGIKQTDEQKESTKGLLDALRQQNESIGKSARQMALAEAARLNATEADKKAVNAIFDEIEAKEKAEKVSKNAEATAERLRKIQESGLAKMREEAIQLEMNAEQLENYNILKSLGLQDQEKIPEALQAEIDKLKELRAEKEKQKEAEQQNRKITTEFERLDKGLQSDGKSGLEQLEEKLASERELTNAYYALQLEDRQLNAEEIKALDAEREAALTAIEQRGSDARKKIQQMETQQKLSAVGGMFKNLSSLMNTESKKMFEIGKAAATAGAIVDGYAAVTKTMASIPYPFNIPLAIAQGVASAVQVQNIAKTKFGDKSMSGATSYSGGQPVVNTASQQSPDPGRTVQVAGIDPNAIFSGSQLIELINMAQSDGAVLNIAR